jgi:hypothetical protein
LPTNFEGGHARFARFAHPYGDRNPPSSAKQAKASLGALAQAVTGSGPQVSIT